MAMYVYHFRKCLKKMVIQLRLHLLSLAEKQVVSIWEYTEYIFNPTDNCSKQEVEFDSIIA